MQNIEVKNGEINKEYVIGLNRLKEQLEDCEISSVLDGIVTFGSHARGTASSESDFDVNVFYKISVRDILFKNNAIPKFYNDVELVSSSPDFNEYRIDGYKYELAFVPLWHPYQRSLVGYLDFSIHDLLNLVYGLKETSKPKGNGILEELWRFLKEEYYWSEKAIMKHGRGMLLSQVKKAEKMLNRRMDNYLRIMKLTSTAFYIGYNSLSLLKDNVWYRNYFDLLKLYENSLNVSFDAMYNIGMALKTRDDELIDKVKSIDVELAFRAMRLVASELEELKLNDLEDWQRDSNKKKIEWLIEEIYWNEF